MDLTAAQKHTLEEFEKTEDEGRARFVVTGCDARTGSLHLDLRRPITLLPSGLTKDRG